MTTERERMREAADTLCIDMWGPDAKRALRIPADPPPKPPFMMPSGSPIAGGCRYMLAAPLSLLVAGQREPTVRDGKPRSHAAFEGWVMMNNNHKRYCVACRDAVWMPV